MNRNENSEQLQNMMTLTSKLKTKEMNNLRDQLIVNDFEQQMSKANNSLEDILKAKDKKIKNHKLIIAFLEKSFNKHKILSSIKIDTYLKDIEEKSQTIQNLMSQLEEINKSQLVYEECKTEILNLKKQIVQHKEVIEENKLILLNERNKYSEELKLKSNEISGLNEKLRLLQCSEKERETSRIDDQDRANEICLENSSHNESQEELRDTLYEYMMGKTPIVSF